MSNRPKAVLFYGFALSKEAGNKLLERKASREDLGIEVDTIGCDSESLVFVAMKASVRKATLFTRKTTVPIDDIMKMGGEPPGWSGELRAFCVRHGISWPSGGPRWNLSVAYF